VGVYCTVAMCVRGDRPLDVDRRVALIGLCLEHRLLRSTCAFGVVEDSPPRGLGEWLKRYLLRKRLGESLGAQVQIANGGTRFHRGVQVVDTASAGLWLEARAREVGTDFIIGCDLPFWRDDDSATQGFRYAAMSAATAVHATNAYRSRNEQSRFEAEDGYVGSFFDVLALDAKRNLDGRIAASSPFVRAVKAKLGVKVTCRASWW
jgi:hypothetical protein